MRNVLCVLVGEAQKAKVISPALNNHFQRRLLPRTEMQQKVQNQSQSVKTKLTTLKGDNVDELDENEINRLTDVNYSLDGLADDFGRQGELFDISKYFRGSRPYHPSNNIGKSLSLKKKAKSVKCQNSHNYTSVPV